MRRPIRSSGLVLGALAALVAGCGEEKLKEPPPAAAPADATVASAGATGESGAASDAPRVPAAQLLVTHGFGAEVALDAPVAPAQSVLSALQTVAEVETAYGGGFVQGIDGVAGDLGRREDWLYFVNGVEAGVGAADRQVRDGDRIWWDYRRWSGYEHVPVVVGAWPEPFVHGPGDDPPAVAADAPLDAALAAAGADVTTDPGARFRVLVGADAALRERSPAWRSAAARPRDAGLTVWLRDGAGVVWDAGEGEAVPVPSCRAAIVALAPDGVPEEAIDLLVVGVDAAAAATAAAALAEDPALVARAYGACLDARGAVVARGGAAPTT